MNLREVRLFEAMPVERLAARLGIPPRSVVGCEAAPLRNLSLGIIIEHCEAMGLKVQLRVTRPDGTQEPLV